MRPLMKASLNLLALVVAALVTTAALAQQNTPKHGYLGTGKELYKLFIFGDDFAGGLWSGTERVAKNHPRLSISGRYREGSGLTRLRPYNWITRLPRTLDNRKIDIAMVFIGNNDARDIRIGNQYLVFGAPEWKAEYARRVGAMMKLFTDRRIAVYWLGTPPVANPKLDDRLKLIGEIQRQAAASAGIRFVDIRKSFTTADDKFTKTGADINGNVVRLRSRNGVRFIKAGNNKLAFLVLEQINKDISIADGDLTVETFPPPSGAKLAIDTNLRYLGPLFSMPASDGSAKIIKPQDMPDPNAPRIATNIAQTPGVSGLPGQTIAPTSQAINQLKAYLKPGSRAENLYENGSWPRPQPGRVDNFSATEN